MRPGPGRLQTAGSWRRRLLEAAGSCSCARDGTAGARIRDRLDAAPPNSRARFVDFSVADHGLQVRLDLEEPAVANYDQEWRVIDNVGVESLHEMIEA